MPDLDEKHLIRRSQHCDIKALSPLAPKYRSRLYAHIHGRVKGTEVAKDLTQETWLKAYRSINNFRGPSAF